MKAAKAIEYNETMNKKGIQRGLDERKEKDGRKTNGSMDSL